MEISLETPSLISNEEVMELLLSRVQGRATTKDSTSANSRGLVHRDWIETQVLAYLQSTPCTRLDAKKRVAFLSVLTSNKKKNFASLFTPCNDDNQTQDETNRSANSVTSTSSRLGIAYSKSGFGLTEAEGMQILNWMPTELVEIHLMIEDLHARMSESEQHDLLGAIAAHVVHPVQNEEAESEAHEQAQPANASPVEDNTNHNYDGNDRNICMKQEAEKTYQQHCKDEEMLGGQVPMW